MFPFLLVFRYLRFPWSHIIYCGILNNGDRVLAFFSSSLVQDLTSASGWHGSWEIHSHVVYPRGQESPIAVLRVNWQGLNARTRVLLFYLREGEIVYFGNRFRSITNVDWWWPGHAEVYSILWYEISERHRLDIIIYDSILPRNDQVEWELMEF